MRSNKSNTSLFDDDFEVTYEEDFPMHSEFDFNTTKLPDNRPKKKTASKKSGSSKRGSQKVDLSIPLSAKRLQEKESPIKTDLYSRRNAGSRHYSNDRYYDDDSYYNDEYDDDYDDNYYRSNSKRKQSRPAPQSRSRRKNSPARLAAPLQKGGNMIFNISASFMRNLSVFLILAILVLMVYNFFRGSAPYGDIENAVSSQTFTQMLAAYIVVAAVLVLFEICSLLWTTSKVRVRDEYGRHYEDVGRGQTSFIFLYLLSYAAFLFSRHIPELSDVLKGVKGALDVFGSLHNALFGLCLAGVISCIVRKHNLTL